MTNSQLLWRETVFGNPEDSTGYLVLADALEEEGEIAAAAHIREAARWVRTQWDNRNCPMFMFSCDELLPSVVDLAREGCERCRRWAGGEMQRVRRLSEAVLELSPSWKAAAYKIEAPL